MIANASPLLHTVDEMLLDAGETDPRLRATLLSLGALASMPVPAPGGELAALLSSQPSQLARHRQRRRHRTAAVGLAVIAGMGLGVTGVAATATAPRPSASPSIQHMLQDWAPSWTVTGLPVTAAAGDLPLPPPAGPGSRAALVPEGSVLDGSLPDGSVPAGSLPAGQGTRDQATGEPGTARPGTGAPGNAGQGNGAGRGQDPGRGAVSSGNRAADGGASRNGAGATNGGGSAPDGTSLEGKEQGAAPGGGTASELEKTGKLVGEAPAVVDHLTSALLAPVATVAASNEKTGAGNAGPGSIWLKKFSR